MMILFKHLGAAIDRSRQPEVLSMIYKRVPRLNFSPTIELPAADQIETAHDGGSHIHESMPS